MAHPQMGEGEQGLAARAQAPPPGADRTVMRPQLPCEEPQGGAGHVDAGRVDKHVKPLVETVLLVENPSTRGFTLLSGQLANPQARLEKAPWVTWWEENLSSPTFEPQHEVRREEP